MILISCLTSLALLGVLLAFLPTLREVLRKGNAADPLRREIEQGEDAENGASSSGDSEQDRVGRDAA